MANPVPVDIPENTWTKVATAVTAGKIKRLGVLPNLYIETYRDTGDPAPTDQNEGAVMFYNGNTEEITATAAIDVYIMALGANGKVRVDIV